jgi:hypothetical protein
VVVADGKNRLLERAPLHALKKVAEFPFSGQSQGAPYLDPGGMNEVPIAGPAGMILDGRSEWSALCSDSGVQIEMIGPNYLPAFF